MSNPDNTPQVALVTGASRGIGAAIALQLARDGFQVCGTATSAEGAERISQALSGFAGCHGAVLQVNDAEQVQALVDEQVSRTGGLHVLVNNAYLGLIRQSQRGFEMDYCVQLAFDNINAPETKGYGVDHVAVIEGLGCKAIRVTDPEQILPALQQAGKWKEEFRVPVVVEIILERVTNISMGTELANVTEFEELARDAGDAPTAIAMLD